MFKSKLQELCHQRQWALPRYTSMKDGPDHNPRFKASVFLNGESFHSSVSCKSSKEAHNEAAKSAFLHFGSSSSSPATTPNPAQEVDFGFYKNLLQELAQREELSIPVYKTEKCGLPHRPTFFSGVEVEGEVFYGKGAKSKKEAEINAAKVAYTNLTERLQVWSSQLHSPEYLAVGNEKDAEESEMLEVKVGEKVFANSTTNPDNPVPQCEYKVEAKKLVAAFFVSDKLIISPFSGLQVSSSDLANAIVNVEHAEENEVQEVEGEEVLAKATTGLENSSFCSKSVPVSSEEESSSMSSTAPLIGISTLSISDSKMEKDPGLKSYLLNNRFRVYPCFPDIAFPKGITVLPISEDKWVAVSLEFPNERDD
ncbi:hypothetical protein PTKIN_Ptkin11bG0071800 [Pterospermum kingtungense]